MKKRLDNKSAKKLQQRLAELSAASNLEQISHLPPPRLHMLSGDRSGQFAVDLKQPERLVFIPNNDPILYKSDGGIDRAKITDIKILEVGVDYHG